MSIKKWIAKKGAVGGTARWAGKGYYALVTKDPNLTTSEICKELIRIRFADPSIVQPLTSLADKGHIRGLAHLVVNILDVEAGFSANPQENKSILLEVIFEELQNMGLSNEVMLQPTKS